MSASLVRLSTATAIATLLAGCYAVPVQVEQGQPPVYAYAPLPVQPANARAQQPVPVIAGGPAQPSAIHVRLYPINDVAAQLGPLQGVVSDQQGGRGTFTVMGAAEPMQGEATRVPDSFPGFGRVMADALGTQAVAARGSRKGIANAYGSRGMYANCEYMFTNHQMGTGACVFSNGAKYQVHFGQ